MATTILSRDPDAKPAETPPSPAREPRKVGLLGWACVAVSLVLATVLAVGALGSDDDAVPEPWFNVEHGSITAIDHAAEVQARDRPFNVEHGSITAIDHAADAATDRPFNVERGSIAAIDHAADAATDDG